MSRFDFIATNLDGLTVIQRKAVEDQRGFLSRIYCADEFKKAGIAISIAQINHVFTSSKGTVRGMHFQCPPYAETKLVSCLQGEIFDVAVDLRRGSPTFLQWHGEILSTENRKSMIIPDGFAHGLQTLTEDCELMYLHTASYHPEVESALNVADPELDIVWPLAVTDISEKDRKHKLIEQNFEGILL